MAKKKYIDYKKQQQELFKRTEGYAAEVRAIYNEALGEIINLVKGTELEEGKPFSFSEYGYSEDVTPIFRNMYSRSYQAIRSGVEKEWILSNENNDELVRSVFGEHSIEDKHFARLFLRNKEAMDAFFARKTGDEGLNLSQKVWKYAGMYKEELENTLDLAIGEGTPANQLATKIKGYLNDPDRWYRRFRVKIGEDEDGNPIYGRKWKRRVYDSETNSYKWVDDNPKKYHPGRGVYRSSYRNAQRLARSETNIAYRAADFERWGELDFVVGIEIKLSNNHPEPDICDDLKGVYPKTFKWTGWHPNCRCYCVPVLAPQDVLDKMLDEILDGGDPGSIESPNEEKELPTDFQNWIKKNEDRIATATDKGTLPYFIKDNKAAVGEILNPLTPEQKHHKELIEKYGESAVKSLYDAFEAFKDKISAGDLAYQIKKLKFEAQWVADKNKFPTSGEMAKMLQAELEKVQAKYDHQLAVEAVKPILAYKSKSKPLNAILAELSEAVDNDATANEIQAIIDRAKAKIHDIEKARLAKLAKSAGGDGSTIDLFASAEEKLEVARLQDLYEKALEKYGSQWNDYVNDAYVRLADYKKELSLKYLDKQGKLVKLNGETEELAAEALEKLPRYNGTVFSGISFDSMQLDKYIQEMKSCMASGTEYVNKAFMSSTTNIDRTTIFGDNLMLVIKSKKGVDVKAISHYPGEDEVVFRAGSKFKVLNVYQETTRKYGFGKGWVVELEEM